MARRTSAAVLLCVLALAGCHHRNNSYARRMPPPPPAPPPTTTAQTGRATQTAPTTESAAQAAEPAPEPKPTAKGQVPSSEVGLASWYGPPYTNHKAADGSIYDQNAMTAAHRTLPLGTVVRVTNVATGQSTTVRITDRGPFVHGRIIDLSLAAAKAIGVYRAGVARVRVEAYVPAQLAGADPGGRWCVQVGAFAHQSDALKLQHDLMRRYSTAKVIEFPGPTGHWVRITPVLPDKAHTTQIASNIHAGDPGAEPYLVRTN